MKDSAETEKKALDIVSRIDSRFTFFVLFRFLRQLYIAFRDFCCTITRGSSYLLSNDAGIGIYAVTALD